MNIIYKLIWKFYKKGRDLDRYIRYHHLRKQYLIDPTFRFNGHNIQFYGSGKLVIGKNSYIGDLSTIQVDESCEVKIGRNCSISHNVRIYTSSVIPDQDWSLEEKQVKYGNVVIEDFVWIGSNVFINPGITIGSNSVIGANSVVTKDVPPFSIVGGVPAKLIRTKKSNA